MAVAATPGKTLLHLCITNRGMQQIYSSHGCNEGSNDVQTVRIDYMIHESDFIKMDIEGAELGALRGMTQLLKKRDVTIIMEFHPPSIVEYGSKSKDIYDLLTSLGYNFNLSLSESLSFEQIEQIDTGTGKESSNIIRLQLARRKI